MKPKTPLLAGSTSGIGLGIATRFARRGICAREALQKALELRAGRSSVA